MVVTAMLVVVMMVVIVRMVTMVTMTVAMMMAGMIVRMTMRGAIMGVACSIRVAVAGIGATFRIERRFDFGHPRPQPLHHVLDHMIAADTQATARDLCRQVAISEMPGDANQMLRVSTADFHERLGRRNHLDQATVLEHQSIAAAQRHCALEIEQEFKPARACHRHPSPVTIVEVQYDGIGRSFAPVMMRLDLRRADHS
jgi:hypothetical protein